MSAPASAAGAHAPDVDSALLPGVPCAVLDLASKRLVDANPSFAALLGLDVSQVKGFDWFSLIPPQNRPRVEAILAGMEAGTIRSIDGRVRWQLPSGESLHVERWLRCLEDDGPHPTKALLAVLPTGGTGVPVQPMNAPDQARLPVGTMDHAWCLSEISLDAAAWFGLDPGDCRGIALHTIVHPDDAPMLLLGGQKRHRSAGRRDGGASAAP